MEAEAEGVAESKPDVSTVVEVEARRGVEGRGRIRGVDRGLEGVAVWVAAEEAVEGTGKRQTRSKERETPRRGRG